jgi:excisionase family DNA binding protein
MSDTQQEAVRYLKLDEVAELSGLSLNTCRKWASSGVLPVTKFGRSVRVPSDLFAEFCARRTKPACK